MEWFKEGQAIDTKREKKFSVVKKKSEVREGETIVQLEIKVSMFLSEWEVEKYKPCNFGITN